MRGEGQRRRREGGEGGEREGGTREGEEGWREREWWGVRVYGQDTSTGGQKVVRKEGTNVKPHAHLRCASI